MTTLFESITTSLTAPATVRSRVTVPLRFPDGYSTVAEVLTFHGLADSKEHLLLAFGAWDGLLNEAADGGTTPLVRLHSECLTGDVFGSERCDCGPQLREAVEQISAAGGFLLYLRQEGRGIGLYSKLDAYALQDTGLDTYEANRALGHGDDERDYTAAAQMLDAVGATSVRLLTNNPDKAAQLTSLGVNITEQIPTGVHLSEANHRYLAAKRDHTSHTLDLPPTAVETALNPDAVETVLNAAAVEPAPVPAPPENTAPDHDGILARVDALIPRLRERAEETEQLRRLPESTMEELKAAGVFQILSPKALGGSGLGVETYAEVIRRLSRGDASTAWTAGHLAEHVWMLARWPQRVQQEVFAGGPAPLAAATGAPAGTAEKVPGGYTISGHWTFASGVMHSEWALLAVQHNGVRMQALVPVAELELLDAWHTAGLRGTGSNDLAAGHLFVPEHRVQGWALLASADNPGSRIHPDPILHTPMAILLNMVAPSAALGAAEHAVELFREAMMVRKVKNTVETRQSDSPMAQGRFAQAYGQLVTARLHWAEAVGMAAASNNRLADPDDGGRAAYRLSLALSAEASAEAVRLVAAGSGGSAQRLAHPLQRIQRDVNVLLSHPTLAIDPILEQSGRGLLGLGFTVPSF